MSLTPSKRARFGKSDLRTSRPRVDRSANDWAGLYMAEMVCPTQDTTLARAVLTDLIQSMGAAAKQCNGMKVNQFPQPSIFQRNGRRDENVCQSQKYETACTKCFGSKTISASIDSVVQFMLCLDIVSIGV